MNPKAKNLEITTKLELYVLVLKILRFDYAETHFKPGCNQFNLSRKGPVLSLWVLGSVYYCIW